MIIKARSSFIILLFNLKLEHFLNPWSILVDFNKEVITVKKRNWYLIGINETTIAFRFVRKIVIKQHLFGANIYVKALGVDVSAYYLPKSKLKDIRNALIKYNQNKKRSFIIT